MTISMNTLVRAFSTPNNMINSAGRYFQNDQLRLLLGMLTLGLHELWLVYNEEAKMREFVEFAKQVALPENKERPFSLDFNSEIFTFLQHDNGTMAVTVDGKYQAELEGFNSLHQLQSAIAANLLQNSQLCGLDEGQVQYLNEHYADSQQLDAFAKNFICNENLKLMGNKIFAEFRDFLNHVLDIESYPDKLNENEKKSVIWGIGTGELNKDKFGRLFLEMTYKQLKFQLIENKYKYLQLVFGEKMMSIGFEEGIVAFQLKLLDKYFPSKEKTPPEEFDSISLESDSDDEENIKQ